MIPPHDPIRARLGEEIAALALAFLPSVPGHHKAELVRRRGSCAEALASFPGPIPARILRRAEGELKECERNRFSIISLASSEYPPLLKEIADPPPALYVWGEHPWKEFPFLAIVGSRRATPYGVEACQRFSAELAERGFTIVSGLARGIDAVAHRAALAIGGRTVAVLGSGLDVIYPREHRRLAEKMAERGVVISEFPLSSSPLPGHFPRRNRIISGLCLGTLIIEAAEKSGSLITARAAAEQNREVFAVPGPIGSPTSRGVHRLIQDGAKLITDTEDVLDELSPEIRDKLRPIDTTSAGTVGASPSLGADERRLLRALARLESADVDQLVLRSRLAAERVTAALVGLEIKGEIHSYPGGIYRAGRPETWSAR